MEHILATNLIFILNPPPIHMKPLQFFFHLATLFVSEARNNMHRYTLPFKFPSVWLNELRRGVAFESKYYLCHLSIECLKRSFIKKSPSIPMGSLLNSTMFQNKGQYPISATLKPDTYGIKFMLR